MASAGEGLTSDSKVFMWATVGYLIRYCDLIQDPTIPRNPMQLGDLNWHLNKNREMTLLVPTPMLVSYVVEDATKKIAQRGIGQMYAYCSYHNYQFSASIIRDVIIKALNTKDHPRFKSHLVVLKYLFSVQDPHSDKRCNEIMDELVKVLKASIKFVEDCEAIATFIIKLGRRYNRAREYLRTNPEVIDWITDFLKNRSAPRSDYEGVARGMHQYMKIEQEQNRRLRAILAKIAHLNAIKASTSTTDDETIWDSDNDLGDHQFQVDEKIDIYDNQTTLRWVTGVIVQIIEEMVQVKFLDKYQEIRQPMWVSRDDERIAPHKEKQEEEAAASPGRAGEDGNQGDDNEQDTDNDEGIGVDPHGLD